MSRTVPAPRRVAGAAEVQARRVVAANTTVLATDEVIEVSTLLGAVNLTLPPASSVPSGFVVEAVRTSGTNAMRWVPDGTDTINGANATYSMSARFIVACKLISDGVSAWRTMETDSSGLVSTTVQIPLGANTVTSADFGLGSLVNAKIVASIRQAAFDATLTNVQAIGNVGGTVTVNGNANATAAVDVSVLVDTRS
jgi:hypothetical protein